MKKVSYLIFGILIGAVFATAGSAFADQLKTLVGKSVAGEYRVTVNGSALANSAIVVDGKAHVPLREVSTSLGADVNINGRTVEITTTGSGNGEPSVNIPVNNIQTERFKKAEELGYEGDVSPETLQSLKNYRATLETYLNNAESNVAKQQQSIDELTSKLNEYPERYEIRLNAIEERKSKIAEIDKEIEGYKSQIADLDARLETLNKILNQ